MPMSATTVRRGLYGMFAGGLLAFGSAAIVMPVANAAPDTCTQSGIATTASSVSASTSGLPGGASADQPGADGHRDAAAGPGDRGLPGVLRQEPAGRERAAGDQPAGRRSRRASAASTVTPTPISEALQTL